MAIDYSPLDEEKPEVIHSPLTDLDNFGSPNYSFIMILILFGLPFIGLLGIANLIISGIVSIFVDQNNIVNTISSYFNITVIILFFAFLIKNRRIQYNQIAFSNFAVKNNFKVSHGHMYKFNLNNYQFSGILGNSLGTVTRGYILEGKTDDFNFEHYIIYRLGLFKSYQIYEVKLNNKFPHIFLDAQSNNKFVSNIRHAFKEDQKLVLEGDFPNYFKVYSEALPEDTLRVLTPDFMQALVDSGQKFDIEIVEDKLYIIQNNQLITSAMFASFVNASQEIYKNLNSNANLFAKYDSGKKLN